MAAAITIERRIEWIDTDAAGIWHYSTATAGRVVAVLIDEERKPTPWPDDIREALGG